MAGSDRHEGGEPDPRNGAERRLLLVGKTVREIGVPTLMLGVFVGWMSGWIPSPITAMAKDVSMMQADWRSHVSDVSESTKVMRVLAGEIHEQNRILRFKECSQITDRSERHLCFGVTP
jgi:galactitol-specific phosphotransferase system IIC component